MLGWLNPRVNWLTSRKRHSKPIDQQLEGITALANSGKGLLRAQPPRWSWKGWTFSKNLMPPQREMKTRERRESCRIVLLPVCELVRSHIDPEKQKVNSNWDSKFHLRIM